MFAATSMTDRCVEFDRPNGIELTDGVSAMERPEVREAGEPMTLVRLRSEVDGLLRGGTHACGNRVVIQFMPREVEPDQTVIHRLARLGTLIGRQIDGARGEVDRESDDAGDEEEEQTHRIERDDAPVQFASRLAAPLRVQDCSAARGAGGGNK